MPLRSSHCLLHCVSSRIINKHTLCWREVKVTGRRGKLGVFPLLESTVENLHLLNLSFAPKYANSSVPCNFKCFLLITTLRDVFVCGKRAGCPPPPPLLQSVLFPLFPLSLSLPLSVSALRVLCRLHSWCICMSCWRGINGGIWSMRALPRPLWLCHERATKIIDT